MSIAKGLILFIFLIMFYLIIALRRENLKQKDFFIKTLSHDFRVATLAQLRGIEYLSKTKGFDKYQTELINEIDKSCRYSLDMISMLMNSYMFEKGEQVIDYENFLLQEVVCSLVELVKPLIKEKNIKLNMSVDKSLTISADKNLIFKLILNLLTTAISYAEANSTITLASKKNKNICKFFVAYHGKSLSEEECGRMFSNQTHLSTVGHGIKMQLCKKIVDFHKGKISVKNYSKKLNSFTFTIPQKQKFTLSKTLSLSTLQAG